MKISLYLKAMRPFSFTVSLVPPVLALFTAKNIYPAFKINWLNFLIMAVAGWLSHGGANVLSDYFDYKNGVDRNDTFGSSGSRVLIEKKISEREALFLAFFCYFLAFIAAVYFILALEGGYKLIWLIAAGAFLGIFYTMKPFNLKYNALGDIAVFLAFGPLMTAGGYFIETLKYDVYPFIYAVPVGFIVVNILHANNIRDSVTDRKDGVKTVANIIGYQNAVKMYEILVYAAYFAVVLLVLFAKLTYWSFLVFLSLPMAINLIREIKQPDRIIYGDAKTAQFHSVFSMLLILGLIVSSK